MIGKVEGAGVIAISDEASERFTVDARGKLW